MSLEVFNTVLSAHIQPYALDDASTVHKDSDPKHALSATQDI